jgi:hypothetical protein
MIWVELLSRHRDVTARFRVDGSEISIGRGYDNDVVVDDPYVAARHVRVLRDETGQLVAEDAGSANGMYLDGSRNRQDRIAIDGATPIRIGHTFIRIREVGHAVEPERLAGSKHRFVPAIAAITLTLALFGYLALIVWFAQTSEPHLSDYLTPMLILVSAALGWIGLWSLLSRLFFGQSHFLRHVLIAESIVLAFAVYDELVDFSAFSLTWPVPRAYEYIAIWVALAVMCFLHLREVGRTHLRAKAIVVAVLLVTVVTVQTLQRSEAYANSGRRSVTHILMPPALRLAPLRDETALFADIGKLKARVDADRAEARSAQARP